MSRNYAGLSRERIIVEALHIISGRGLGGLSMRRLGDALEVEAMAVYHHFPLGKEQLFNAIAAYVTSPSPTGTALGAEAAEEEGRDTEEGGPDSVEVVDPGPWDARLTDWARVYRARLLEYSGALSLLVHRAPRTEADTATRALVHGAFTEAGLSGDDVERAADALYSYCVGAVIHEVRHRDDEDAPDGAEREVRFRFGLRSLLRGLTAADA
ncbi:TetR/AcrR family transcriptional regulator [Nocardiopsis sp. EMB25]|uniref:TetR/AcrR family transcriptional regulator n=1 Tax=Nocardiopsis TaxID=2013 RepID=UPI00034BE465|nr:MULTISPECIES: TetR/AcrR family transcriptional regulator [Nocardiopsis]MCY9784134.1 TetR/AcrR family transcriptional regulator [Nocardiopsis sp. EMB25]